MATLTLKNMDETYKIQRFFFGQDTQTIKTGLTLEEAREHCSDPETSSRTCSQATRDKVGPSWFDGYTAE